MEQAQSWLWQTPSDFPWVAGVVLVFSLYVAARLGWLTLKSAPAGLFGVFRREASSAGEIAPVAGFAMALGATVSAGSAVGVAAAIHHAGPGALFWMWLVALLVAPLNFAYARLSRDHAQPGVAGPADFARPLAGAGLTQALMVFGILAALGWGALTQSAVASEAAQAGLGLPAMACAVVCAGLVLFISIKGTRAVAAICTVLVPVLVLGFVATAIALLLANYRDIPETFGFVRDGVIRLEAGLGGALAGVFTVTMAWGVKAAFFSTGMFSGSAGVAFASVRGPSATRLGGLAGLTPIFDTLVISTLVGFCVVITQSWDQKAMTTVPAAQATAVPARFMEMEGQQTEFQWVQSGLSKLAAVPTSTSPITVQVNEGDQLDLFFIVEHGLVDTGLLQTADGRPYTGPLTVDLVTSTMSPPDLQLQGYMLRTRAGLLQQAFTRGFKKAKGGLSALADKGPGLLGLFLLLCGFSAMLVWAHIGTHFASRLGGAKTVLPFRVAYALAIVLGGLVSSAVALPAGELLLTLFGLVNVAVLALSLSAAKRTD